MNGARLRHVNKDAALVALVVGVAAFLRFYRIDQVPPGLHFDEAYNIADILGLLQGHLAIFFPANFGREPLYIYLSTVAGALFGAQALTLRLTSAIVGTATVVAMYAFARSLFRSRLVAALSSLLLAISVWHIYYSRLGLRVVLAVPLVLLALFWFWRAVEATLVRSSRSNNRGDGAARDDARDNATSLATVRDARNGRTAVLLLAGGQMRAYAFAGLFTSLAVYTYTSGRLIPFILVVLSAAAVLIDRINWRRYLVGLAITGLVALAVFGPLGYYFANNPSDFIEHGSNQSITDPRVNHGDLVGTLWNNIGAVAGMFLVRGDKEAFRNVPFRPVFDPFVGALFLIGLGVWAVSLFGKSTRIRRLRAFFIAVCLVVLVSPSVLSDAPPNFTRTLPALPIAIVLAAWGAVEIRNRLTAPPTRRLWLGAIGCVLLLSSAVGFEDYFVRFADDPALYYAFDERMFDVSQWIHRNTASSQIYLAPLWYQNGTLGLLTRDTALKSFESRDTVVLPSRSGDKDALYAFPSEQANKAATLGDRLGALAHPEDFVGSDGERLLVVYRVRAADLPDETRPLATLARGGEFIQPQETDEAKWGDELELIGHSIAASDPPKRNLEVTLYLRALKPVGADYTYSVKVRDGQDRTWGQQDKWPGDNSYPTTEMSAGDLVVEKFYPGLNACAPGGGYRVTVEVYDPKTGQVATVDGGGNSVVLGTVEAGASEGNRLQDLEMDQATDVDVAPQLHLLGLTLTPQDLKPGEPFSLSLFWRGAGDGYPARSAPVVLRDSSGRQFPLADPAVSVPSGGSGLCTFLDLIAPPDAAAGPAALIVGGTSITSVNVER